MKTRMLGALAALVLFQQAALAETFPVPGGPVNETWGIVLPSMFGEDATFRLASGPSWSSINGENVLEGVPDSVGETTFEVEVQGGENPGAHTLSAWFW